MRVVYVDILIVLNAYMTLFQLAAAARICRVRLKGWKIALGSLAGGAAALLFFAPFPAAVTAAVNLLCAAVIVLIGLGVGTVRGYLLRLAAFVGAGAVMAGAAIAVQLIIRPADDFYSGGVYYFDIPPLLLIGVTAAVYGAVRLFGAIIAGRASAAPLPTVIELDGRRVSFDCISDSGNLLSDPVCGCRVMVAELGAVESLFEPREREFFSKLDPPESGRLGGRLRVIPCRTAGGGRLLPAFRPDAVKISGAPAAENLLVAVTDSLGCEYRGLLPVMAAERGRKQ